MNWMGLWFPLVLSSFASLSFQERRATEFSCTNSPKSFGYEFGRGESGDDNAIRIDGPLAFGEDPTPQTVQQEEVRLSIHSPQVVVRTLLLAVLKAAPENLRENLLRAIGSGIKDQLTSLDFGSVSWFKSKWHPHHRQTLMHMLHMSLLTKTVSGLFMIGAIWCANQHGSFMISLVQILAKKNGLRIDMWIEPFMYIPIGWHRKDMQMSSASGVLDSAVFRPFFSNRGGLWWWQRTAECRYGSPAFCTTNSWMKGRWFLANAMATQQFQISPDQHPSLVKGLKGSVFHGTKSHQSDWPAESALPTAKPMCFL